MVEGYFKDRVDIYYRHYDGYPRGLGVDLLKLLMTTPIVGVKSMGRIGLERLHSTRVIGENAVRMAYPNIRADIDWIYYIGYTQGRPYIIIYRTTNPWLPCSEFVQVYSKYIDLIDDPEYEMEIVQYVTKVARRFTELSLRLIGRRITELENRVQALQKILNNWKNKNI